jgi:hypothetical protein
VLRTWNLIGSNLYAGFSSRKWDAKSSQHPQTVFLTEERTYFGADDGSLSYAEAGGDPVEFSRNNLLQITSLEVVDNVVALGSDQGLVIYTLATNDRAFIAENIITDFSFGIYSNPFATAVGLELYSEREMLLWDMSENQQGIAFLDTWMGIREKIPTESVSPYLQVESLPYSLLTLEKNGRVRVIQEIGGDTLFEYTSPGLKKVIAVDEQWLIGAGNRSTGYSGALVRINRNTLETVQLSGSSLLAYDLAYDAGRDVLYSLSIDRTAEGTMTVVKRHIGPDFENEQSIVQYAGEDLSASLHYSPENRELYVSLGYGPVRIWNGWSMKILEQSCHIPRALRASGRLVYSLNQDSTISIWDRKSGKLLTDVYLFHDLSWVAVFPSEKTYLSEAAEDYLIFSRSGSRFRLP